MARASDILVQPGERALFHAPRRWMPANWASEAAAYAGVIGLGALSGLLTVDSIGLVALGAALSGALGFTLYTWIRDWSSVLLVTDRRLVHRSGWLAPRTAEVAARDVHRVRAARDRIRIERLSGRTIDVNHPREAWVGGIALAYAAGIAWPRLPTRREVAATHLWSICFLGTGLSIALVLLNPLVAAYAAGVVVVERGVFVPLAIFVGMIGLGIGAYLGTFLAVVLLRPFLTHAEMIAWIDHSAVFWPPPRSGAEIDWLGLWCKGLADLLYGQVPDAEAGGRGH